MPPPEAPLVWTQPFRVRAYEVGPGGVASPLAVLDYFQDAAGEHAHALGGETFEIGEAGGAWVMSRLAVEFERLPAGREQTVVETWASRREGLRVQRDFLLRSASGEVLARAATLWFVVDIARRRPVRLPPMVLAMALPDRPSARALGPEPLAPEAAATARTFGVRRADLDRNGHANNARFAEWALEAAPEARDGSALRSLDLAFKGEALAGETVVSEASGGAPLAHAILRESDRRLLATATSTWT